MARAIPPLNELVGLPAATAAVEIADASEECFRTLVERASRGDRAAQRELIRLRLAYLNWAYGSASIAARAPRPSS